MLNKLLQLTNDNHSGLIAVIITAGILLYAHGCQSQVKSLNDPQVKVSRDELQAEVDAYLAMAKARFADLDRQDAIKMLIFEQAALFAERGTVNPFGLLTTAISVVAVGSALDQRRKKNELCKKINGLVSTTPTTESP